MEILLVLIFLVLIYIAIKINKIASNTYWTMRFVEEVFGLGDFKK